MHERKRKLIKRRKTKLSLEIHIKKNNCTTSFMSVGKLQKKNPLKKYVESDFVLSTVKGIKIMA